MKISKKDRLFLNRILSDMKRAQAYLLEKDTLVCRTTMPHNLSFYNKDGVGITPMNKEIGSDLHRLHAAIYDLENRLTTTIDDKTLSVL